MSLVDEILAKHKLCDGCVTGCGRHCRTCQHFWSNEWPCESVRLALSLKTAEQALEVAMCLKHSINGEHGRGGPLWAEPCPEASLSEEVKCRYARAALLGVPVERLIPRVLAEYDKEGQG